MLFIDVSEGWEGEQRFKDDFYRKMDDIGVWSDYRLQSVAPDIGGGGILGEAGRRS